MTSRPLFRPALAALLLAALAAPAAAREQSLEVGILGGVVYLDPSLAGPDGPTLEPTIGVRAAGPLPMATFGWFADALYADIATETFRLGARSIALRAGLEWHHPDMPVSPWFLAFGLGYHDLSFDMATDYGSMFVSAGIGQKIRLGGRSSLRWELRADHSLSSAGLMGEDITQPQALIGLSWDLGRKRRAPEARVIPEPEPPDVEIAAGTPELPQAPQPDADSDGIFDAADRCPSTLLGIEVADDGCPRDDDDDGVYDGLGMDRCPGTPRGAAVDTYGCPLDSDGDGIFDGLDLCPDTAPGAAVNDQGC